MGSLEERHKAHCLRVGQAIEAAAGELPGNWELQISVERGAAVVSLFDPEGQEVDDHLFDGSGEGLGEDIENAVACARCKHADGP